MTCSLFKSKDDAVAQAVSRWLPTVVAQVRVRAACGVCGGQSSTVRRFSLSTLVSPANHTTNSLHHYNHLVAAGPSGPSWTPPPHYTN
jgi:hypothetical protein